MAHDSIEEFEGMVYCVMRSIDTNRPVIQESWYATDLNAHHLKRSYGDDIIGCKLEYDRGFHLRLENGHRICVHTTGGPAARYIEVPIDPPKSRLPVKWQHGQW